MMKYSYFLLFFAISASAYIIAPNNGKVDDKDWWQTAVFYQIYPRSFKDSNGDGVGDIRGVIDKLDHLKDAGVQATWLSPIMKSPQADFGYDISDFTDIDPLFGTMEDFEELVTRAKDLDIKIIMDFVPNHSSDEHDWFKKSIERDPEYEDYYVWHDGKVDQKGDRIPPNNWQSVFYGSAWTWNEKRGQYYLHQFDKRQPDLNYRNKKVVDAMKDVLKFWLDKGASGFRVDAINHLFEVEDLRDEPETGWTSDPLNYGFTHHYYTKDLDETYEMVQQWRELLDEYTAEQKTETKIIMTEAYANQTFTAKFYDYKSHFPFNFGFIENLRDFNSAYDIRQIIDDWLDLMPKGATANWVLGNHDKPRVASRFGFERHDGMLAIEMTLPGVAVTYNGEEIGMVDHRDISWEETVDPQACNGPQEGYEERSRDPQRTPFQWDDTKNGGFTDGDKTWLPLHPNYKNNNLAKQKEMEKSYFSFYKNLTNLRKSDVLKHGTFRTYIFGDKIYSHIREFEGEYVIVVVNLSYKYETIDITRAIDVANDVEIIAVGHRSTHNKGEILDAKSVEVRSYDALILREKKKENLHSRFN